MHTEHLQNVTPGGVLGGWLVAVAVTSLGVLVFEASGIDVGGGARDAAATIVAQIVGFGAGGFFTGFRVRRAPVLHGIGIGLVSLVVAVAINGLASRVGWAYGTGLGAVLTAGFVLVMIVAAVVGALIGYNMALRGRPGLKDGLPD